MVCKPAIIESCLYPIVFENTSTLNTWLSIRSRPLEWGIISKGSNENIIILFIVTLEFIGIYKRQK
jgi:hypothetical protein